MNIKDETCNWLRKKACLHLHVPHIEVFLTLDFYDENGALTKHHRQRAKSWVRNAYNVFFNSLSSAALTGGYGSGTLSIRNTAGAVVSHANGLANVLTYQSPAQSVIYGIIAGRGASSFSFEDHTVDTVIEAGNGANQLFSPIGDAISTSYTAGTKTYKATWSRVFNNNSGADIALTNIGLVAWLGIWRSTSTYSNTLFSKDVLAPSQTILDKAQLRVTYEISMVFPA